MCVCMYECIIFTLIFLKNDNLNTKKFGWFNDNHYFYNMSYKNR